MAGGVGAGASAQAVGQGTPRPAGTQGDEAGTSDFAGLLGEAAPPAQAAGTAPRQRGAGEDTHGAPDGREPGTDALPATGAAAGTPALPPAEPASGGPESLAGQMLALLGITLPGAGADPEPAPPRATGALAPRAAQVTGGMPVLPGLAQPAAAAELAATVAGNAAGSASSAASGDALPSAAQPFAALEALDASVLETGRDTSASQTAAQPAVQARAPAPALPPALAAPLSMPADPDGGFDDGLGARIGWMAGQQLGRAEIRLNPEQLGVIDLRLELDGNRVSVELASGSQDVRQALEASLARLREMLAQQGLDLARADVGSGRREDGGGQGAPANALPAGGSAESGEHATDPAALVTLRRHGLLDEYA